MEKITKAEALRRWNSAKEQKKAMVEKMRKMLYEDYKARTGEDPITFNVL
ncbi:MAG: protein tyrosine phosphatase [Prevotella stercorea]|nr:protein tyrosine phosphatase [Prevotella sp.]MDD6494959.1 protein tyrosine phosphatase [Leyella stercorea]MCI6342371.1 protein tyrosine phosphatase [Prevotella sp.]MCI6719100.1 protein tyrosine phosphatase [Prevotella sp.]MCI6898846.1 protein tyrosine phosphatase [Prevotella sp.]